MVDLKTNYLGLQLKNPLVASPSPLSEKVENVKRLEEAGVSAVVLYSLFEEQILHESLELDHFLSQGYEVVIVDDLSTGRASNLNPAAKFCQVDIRSQDLADVFAAERPDFISHHAAQMNVRRSVVDPLFDADVNVRGSINLLECARQFGVKRVVYISTGGAVYGEPVYLPCDNHQIRPTLVGLNNRAGIGRKKMNIAGQHRLDGFG